MKYDIILDKELKIQTAGWDACMADDYRHPYEPTPYEVLDRLIDSEYITEDNIVVDYGCGKGRVSFYLADRLGCETIGIEYDERLYKLAVKNRGSFVGRRKPQFVLALAESYEVEAGDCFYFFNPFTVELLQAVVGKILASYYRQPRQMLLFFYYPHDAYVAYLMEKANLMFVDEIGCEDLFAGHNKRERILIFEVIG